MAFDTCQKLAEERRECERDERDGHSGDEGP